MNTKMKMLVIFLIIIMILAILLSLYTRIMEIRINHLNKDIRTNYEQLQSLKSQWNYLNNKEYLETMINKHLPQLKYDIKPVNNLNSIP